MDYDVICDDVQRQNTARKGRPIKVCEKHMVEVRLTPPDKKRPTFNTSSFTKFVAFEEGGEGTDKALHYHIILETTLSDYLLTQVWYALYPSSKGAGNKLFRHGQLHDKSYAYCAKHKTPVCIVGYTESDLQTWYKESDEYIQSLKREREQYRKIKSKGRKAELKSVEQDVKEYLKQFVTDGQVTQYVVRSGISRFLALCKERQYDFPTRTQMDTIMYRLLYDIDPSIVVALFSRNLSIEHTINANQESRW